MKLKKKQFPMKNRQVKMLHKNGTQQIELLPGLNLMRKNVSSPNATPRAAQHKLEVA